MSELTDDQLDGLFRKSAEEFDPPFDPAAWQDMKTRLDKHDGNPPGGLLPWSNWLRWGLPVILLLLLTGAGWYAYNRIPPAETIAKTKVSPANSVPGTAGPSVADKSRQEPDQQLTTEPTRNARKNLSELTSEVAKKPAVVSEAASVERNSDERLNKPGRPKELEPALVANATNRSKPAYKVKPGDSREEASRFSESGTAATERINSRRPLDRLEKSGLSTQKQSRSNRKRKKMAFLQMREQTSVVSVDKQPLLTNQRAGQTNSSEATESVLTPGAQQIETVSVPTLAELRIHPARWPMLSSLANRPVVTQPDTAARRVVPKSNADRGLSVRFVVAPDLSTVGLKNFSRPGTNVGLLLEYRLASRWSVQAGVIQSTKIYRALPSEYTYHQGDWGGYVPPASVDGRCSMLDIPINLRYDVFVRPGSGGAFTSRWFVSGGVTSYIIQREKYVYNYDKYVHNQKSGADTTSGGYGLSNLNFSVGYERALSRRLSWQVEPFIKAPLKGVGYFKTNLLSTGVFFSIRYKL